MALDERLLEILACPKCKGDLEYNREDSLLICPKCKLAYPVRDDIPILIEKEAKRIE